MSFCHMHNMPPFPTSEHVVCRFVAHLANSTLKHTSMLLSSQPPPPDRTRLGGSRHGIHGKAGTSHARDKESTSNKASHPTRQPITMDLLRNLHAAWSSMPRPRDKVMLWAAASLCFFGFLRSGESTVPSDSAFDEATHLTFKDVSVDRLNNPTILKVRLNVSKTDPFRVGVEVCVGRSGCALYPVRAMLDYLVIRGAGPGLLFQICRWETPDTGQTSGSG